MMIVILSYRILNLQSIKKALDKISEKPSSKFVLESFKETQQVAKRLSKIQ